MTNKEFMPHGFITISNTGGIEIMLNRSNDGVYYRFNYGQDLEKEEIFESEIFYGYKDEDQTEFAEGETMPESLPYFVHSYDGPNNPTGKEADIKYFLSDAMRLR